MRSLEPRPRHATTLLRRNYHIRQLAPVSLTLSAIILGTALVAAGQALSPKDMQQKLDQEMANTKRSASESASGTRQSADDVASDAERKMEEAAIQHKSQAEAKMAEETEKAKKKQKDQDMGR